jgi:enterochelin esterase-like enzyme
MGNRHLFISLVFIIASHICPAQTDSAFFKVDSVPAFPDPPAGFDVHRDNIPHGKLTVVQYRSKTLGKFRQMSIYMPPGYSSATKYPVMYLLHGLGEDYRQWTEWCQADNIIVLINLGPHRETPLQIAAEQNAISFFEVQSSKPKKSSRKFI